MTPERWQQIESLYYEALEQAPPQRAGFLNQRCGSDSELRREVESLLAQVSVDGALDRPAFEPDDAAEIPIGTLLGPYRIEGIIGTGGMG